MDGQQHIESLGLELLELRVSDERIAAPNTSDIQPTPGGLFTMNVTHGFHTTMTALPGKGDELVEFFSAPRPERAPAPPRTASSSS
jgi:hypothetical protein